MEWTIKYRDDVDAYQAICGDRTQWMDLQENWASGLRIRIIGNELHVHARVQRQRWFVIPDPQLLEDSARLAVQAGETFARARAIRDWVYLRHLELAPSAPKPRNVIKPKRTRPDVLLQRPQEPT